MTNPPELRQTSEYARYMKSLGWKVGKLKNGIYIYTKKVLPFFFISKIQRFDGQFTITELLKNIKSKGIHSVYLETNSNDNYQFLQRNLKFKKSKNPLVPSKTIKIDLRKSELELLKNMHYKTRYNIKKLQDSKTPNKLEIKNSKNIKTFAKFWQKNAIKGAKLFSLKKEIKEIYKAFGKKAKIFVAQNNTDWLGAIMTLETKDTIYYMYAASTPNGKKLFVPTTLVWEIIKYGKKQKLKFFDFEGIFDDRYPLAAWKGFTRFKLSFGGEEIIYPRTLKKLILKFRNY